MTLVETRLKLLEITRPNNTDPSVEFWLKKAKALEEYVVGVEPKAEAVATAKKDKPAGITSTKASVSAT